MFCEPSIVGEEVFFFFFFFFFRSVGFVAAAFILGTELSLFEMMQRYVRSSNVIGRKQTFTLRSQPKEEKKKKKKKKS